MDKWYPVKRFCRTFSEAWTACLMMMVQGDLSVVTLHHAFTAAKTGTLAGLGVLIVALIQPVKPNKFAIAWVTGLLTMCADVIIHPTHFGEWWAEAILTGVGAGLLALLLNNSIYREN